MDSVTLMYSITLFKQYSLIYFDLSTKHNFNLFAKTYTPIVWEIIVYMNPPVYELIRMKTKYIVNN